MKRNHRHFGNVLLALLVAAAALAFGLGSQALAAFSTDAHADLAMSLQNPDTSGMAPLPAGEPAAGLARIFRTKGIEINR